MKMKKAVLFFLCLMMAFPFVISAEEDPERNYLFLESSDETNSGLRISSIGALGFGNDKFAHLNFSYVESKLNRSEIVLDIGVGVAYKYLGTFFAGGGYMFGYNSDQSDVISAYYPEVGIAAEFTPKFAVVVRARRIFNIYEQTESVLSIGVLFGDL